MLVSMFSLERILLYNLLFLPHKISCSFNTIPYEMEFTKFRLWADVQNIHTHKNQCQTINQSFTAYQKYLCISWFYGIFVSSLFLLNVAFYILVVTNSNSNSASSSANSASVSLNSHLGIHDADHGKLQSYLPLALRAGVADRYDFSWV